jgi:uncharacterized protein YndB with AHSA1/START domain
MLIETIGAMQVSLPSDREIVLTRHFDAPRSLVFEAFTRPEHLKRWWGMRGSTMLVCEVDLRVGGAWRFVTRERNGKDCPFKGEYREIAPPERLVYTLIYDVEGAREHPGLVTEAFTDKDGGTTLVETMLFPSLESRDGVLHSGMSAGAAETYDRLAELLATMVAQR